MNNRCVLKREVVGFLDYFLSEYSNTFKNRAKMKNDLVVARKKFEMM